MQTHTDQQYRSLAINQENAGQDWAWIREFSAGDWRLEDAANPCNRLPPLPHGVLPPKPFKNLYYYTEDDAEIFFGRCQATLDILNVLEKPEPVILLHGGTGVGKSSFLRAGLIPRLASRGQALHYFRYSEYDPQQSLGIQILGADDPLNIRNNLPHTASTLATVWIIDQMEEIFLPYSGDNPAHTIPARLQELLATLHALLYPLDGRAKVILCIRKEWYPELEYACEQYGLDYWKYFLLPLGKTAIVEVIESPASIPYLHDKYHLTINNPVNGKLAEQIADDLLRDENSGITPTLQIILSKLWQQVENQNERIWDKALYLKEQKSGLLLENYLDQQLQDIADKETWGGIAKESGLLLDVLHTHITPQNTAKTIKYKEYDRLYQHIGYRLPLLVALKNHYLLIEPQSSKDNAPLAQTRLAHDTIAQLISIRFGRSELPGQKARRLLNEWKTNWAEKDGEEEQEKPALDRYSLKTIENGQYGTTDWRQDAIEVAILRKSYKQNKYKGIYNLASLTSIFFVFILVALLAIYLPGLLIEKTIDDINKEYRQLHGEFKENSWNKDIFIKNKLIPVAKKLETIDDEKINKRYCIYKYDMLTNLYLMDAVIRTRTTNDNAQTENDSIAYGKILIELINKYDSYDNLLDDNIIYYNTIFNSMYAHAIQGCKGNKDAGDKVEYLKKYLPKDYLSRTLTKNDICLYEMLNPHQE